MPRASALWVILLGAFSITAGRLFGLVELYVIGVSMGVAVDGQYGIEAGIICGLPCVCKGGQWSVVEGLELDAFSKPRIDASVAELREEYDAVKELGLI